MIKAIQTKFKGYNFRSRLEARYAVFFDALGIEWDYEPEGFELPDGTRYLPDFFIRMRRGHHMRLEHENAGYWVEIKGQIPTFEECEVMAQLCHETGHHGLMLSGIPGEQYIVRFNRIRDDEEIATAKEVAQDKAMKHFYSAALTIYKEKQDPLKSLFLSEIVGECADIKSNEAISFDEFFSAVNAARSARFEFGQSGASV